MAKSAPTNKKEEVVKKKKKVKLASPKVVANIFSSYNNTIVNISSASGQTIAVASAGTVGFKGSKKSTAYAATKAGEQAAEKASKLGAQECIVVVKGIGVGRQSAIKGIRAGGLRITQLSDHTPVPHGGGKPRKKPKK